MIQKKLMGQETLVKEGQLNFKVLVQKHPEMQPWGLEYLKEVLGVEPEFYVHSIANRRDRILVAELYTHIYTYARNRRCSKLCQSFT